MKCQILFSAKKKNKKNIINLSSADLLKRVVGLNSNLYLHALNSCCFSTCCFIVSFVCYLPFN